MNNSIRTFYAFAIPDGFLCSNNDQVMVTNHINVLSRESYFKVSIVTNFNINYLLAIDTFLHNYPVRIVKVQQFVDHVDVSFHPHLHDILYKSYIGRQISNIIFVGNQSIYDKFLFDSLFDEIKNDFYFYRHPIIDSNKLTAFSLARLLSLKNDSVHWSIAAIKNFHEGLLLKPLTKEEAFVEKLSSDYGIFDKSDFTNKFYFDLPKINTFRTNVLDIRNI